MNGSLPLKTLSSSVCIGWQTEGWNLDAAADDTEADRTFDFEVPFATPFSAPPVVHVGLTGFDIDQCSSGRLRLILVSITETGFRVQLSTWCDSRVYSTDFQWLAIGT